jgi:hypothetical protein
MIWGRQTTAAVPALPGGMLLLLAGLLLFVGYRMGRRRRAPRWMAVAVGLGLALVPLAVVHATSTFGVPFTFTNGTVADATQVNSNFTAVANELNALRNQTAVVGECEFQGRDTLTRVVCGFGGGGASIDNPGDNALVGPLHVPTGAAITSIDIWVTDTNTSTNLSVCMWGLFDSFGSYDHSVPCAATSGAPGIVKLTITPPSGTVQGSGESFELFVLPSDSSGNFVAWPTDFSLAARTAYVHYQSP